MGPLSYLLERGLEFAVEPVELVGRLVYLLLQVVRHLARHHHRLDKTSNRVQSIRQCSGQTVQKVSDEQLPRQPALLW